MKKQTHIFGIHVAHWKWKKLYTVNNSHAITGVVETTGEGDLCVFQKDTFCLLPKRQVPSK